MILCQKRVLILTFVVNLLIYVGGATLWKMGKVASLCIDIDFGSGAASPALSLCFKAISKNAFKAITS